MTVKELMELLEKQPQWAEVVFETDNAGFYKIQKIGFDDIMKETILS